MNPTLLIVGDDEEIRTQMRWALAQEYEVCLAERNRRPLVRMADIRRKGHEVAEVGNSDQIDALQAEVTGSGEQALVVGVYLLESILDGAGKMDGVGHTQVHGLRQD